MSGTLPARSAYEAPRAETIPIVVSGNIMGGSGGTIESLNSDEDLFAND